MPSVLEERRCVKETSVSAVFSDLIDSLLDRMTQHLDQTLEEDTTHLLARRYHKRRVHVSRWITSGQCARCGSDRSQRFSRNGTRPRQLLTRWGLLNLHLPRVRCVCGGSVKLDFGSWLRPYQRVSNEINADIQHWGALCVSLRQMQQALSQAGVSVLSLRTLCGRLHQLCTQTAPPADLSSAPPILQIDAIWVTQLRPNGHTRLDAKGRKRTVKGRFKRPLLLALGVWPEANRTELLAWRLAEDESADAWLAFLTDLEERGLRGKNGLHLIIHDGGSGLCAALQEVHFDAEQQRCLFHKLRNIAEAIQLPETLTPAQRRRQRRAILKDFRAIWQAQRYSTSLRRYLQVVRHYRLSQPKAVACLRRDFRFTVTYFRIEPRHPCWPRCFLRTTSRLERFNETLREHFDVARAYHSDVGILAVVAQEADRLKTRSASAK